MSNMFAMLALFLLIFAIIMLVRNALVHAALSQALAIVSARASRDIADGHFKAWQRHYILLDSPEYNYDRLIWSFNKWTAAQMLRGLATAEELRTVKHET